MTWYVLEGPSRGALTAILGASAARLEARNRCASRPGTSTDLRLNHSVSDKTGLLNTEDRCSRVVTTGDVVTISRSLI
jgi:hypothetical protein